MKEKNTRSGFAMIESLILLSGFLLIVIALVVGLAVWIWGDNPKLLKGCLMQGTIGLLMFCFGVYLVAPRNPKK